MTDSSLASIAARINAVARLSGTFTLRSGAVTDHYFDKYRFEADPILLADIAEAMSPLIPAGTEVLAGLEMGGIPVVTTLSRATGLPAAFVRKMAKGYGTMRLAEGSDLAGRRVLVVEDVVTSGGQIAISTHELRALGAEVSHAVCVVDRQEGGAENLARDSITLLSLINRELLDAHRT